MYQRIKNIYKYDKFLFTIGICVIFILVVALFRAGKRGTWNRFVEFPIFSTEKKTKKVRGDSSGEIECRRVLEKIYKKPFKKDRPSFLSNAVTGGHNLELDCVNYDVGVAVEYQGRQHYEYVPYFHKNKEAFLNQKYRDELKRHMCKGKIHLIEVPYTVKIADIESYLVSRLPT